MAPTLPYLASPGTLETALKKIKEAATPERFTRDFLNTVLKMKGGSANAVIPYLKKIGFLNSDATPSGLYDRFRNPATSGHAVAEAMRIGYKPLYQANEYAHALSDSDLKGLIVQVTGLEKGSSTVRQMNATFKRLRSHANFEDSPVASEEAAPPIPKMNGNEAPAHKGHLAHAGMNLSYTINLNLPATTNIEVFHAIFKSLREHLLSE